MANIRQLASGHWQVQIRLKGRKATETFIRYDHTREWASNTESLQVFYTKDYAAAELQIVGPVP